MAMTARLWSINALATELDLDRRTVGARLRHVAPDGELSGHPAWRLKTALRAIEGEGVSKVDAGPPPLGAEMLANVREPVSVGFGMCHLHVLYSLPQWAASIAVGFGVPMDTAFNLANALAICLMNRTAETARKTNVEPWASSPKSVVYNTAAFAPIAWKALREKAGEPNWTPPRPAPGWAELPAE